MRRNTGKSTWKKLSAAVCAAMLTVGLLTACQSSKLADCFTEDEVKEQAVKDIELAASDNYQGWVDRFQEDLKSSLTEDTYATLLAELEKKGEFEKYGKTAIVGQEQDGKNYAGAIVIAEYANGKLTYTISYNEDMELVGFLIK